MSTAIVVCSINQVFVCLCRIKIATAYHKKWVPQAAIAGEADKAAQLDSTTKRGK
jgi:hypothetical protein